MTILLVAQAASAQVATGVPAFSSFGGGPFDTVNDANGNVSFAIPVVSKAGRGVPFNYSLAYNSSVWVPYNSSGTSVWTPVSNWGWGGASSATTGTVTYMETQASCEYPPGPSGTMYYWNVYDYDYYYDPSGTQHQINQNVSTWTSAIPCSNGLNSPNTHSGTLNDGSGYSYTVDDGPSATVYPTSGSTMSVPVGGQTQGSVTDTNGNSITFTSSSGTTTFTDTLGSTALTVSGSGTPSSPVYHTYTGGSGPAGVQVNYASYTVQTNFGCSGIVEVGPTQAYLVSSITMPDNTTYSFTYETTPGYSPNVTGRLASVTLPTGGTISYAYLGSNNGIMCRDGTPPTLRRTTPDSSPKYWEYDRTETALSSGMSWTTTVTDPDSNQTVVNFWADYAGDAYLTERQVAGLETLVTCYNNSPSPCTNSSNSTPISLPITQRTVTTTLGSMESETNTYYNNYGFVTKVDEYDFGSGAVGAFKRETMRCPYSFTDTYIQDRPQYNVVYSATGNPSTCTGTSGLVAETQYSYDANGNLLKETRTNTGGSPSSIMRSFTYGSHGVLQTLKDYNGNTTTYSNFTCANNTAFPQTITPQISSLAVTQNWNCNGGVVISVKDANGQTATYTYDDPFWRLTGTQYADGGQTTITYTDSESAFSVATSRLVATGTSHAVTQTLDGLGRVIKSADAQASSEVATTYDSLGRVHSVSNPYASQSDTTYGLTVYGYDALSRVNSITYPDTSAASISYSGNCSTTTDPAGNPRKLCSDALGRLTSVEEDPGGSYNYDTTYTYDDLNDLTGVTQSSQNRTYSYDMLARLTSSKTPEVNVGGTQCSTTYSYDANGNLTSRKAPREGQNLLCSTSVTTTYGYDGLNRITSKAYSDSTPRANFFYDQAPSSWPAWSGVAFSYPLGRLLLACTGSAAGTCTSPQTAGAFNYDPVGRIKDFWQCGSTANCSSVWDADYTYDLAGDVTQWVHPAMTPFTVYTPVNSAQQVTSVSSSMTGASQPQYLAQSISYTPWGAVSQLENGCAGTGCANAQESYIYNKRLQPWAIEVGTTGNPTSDYCKVYNYYSNSSWSVPTSCPTMGSTAPSGTGNNGNVNAFWYLDNSRPASSYTSTYGYDPLNRLSTATAQAGSTTYWSQTYTYDRYGNMTCSGTGLCGSMSYNSNNQLTGMGSATLSYDAAGNLMQDSSSVPAHSYQWDAEGRLISIDSGATASMTFNALGQRVYVSSTAFTGEYWRDPSGQFLGGMGSGAYNAEVPFGGRLLAEYAAGDPGPVYFDHPDALGSGQQWTDWTGSSAGEVSF